MNQYYNVNGIPTKKPHENSFWILELNNSFSLSYGDCTGELDIELVKLGDKIGHHIFGSKEDFHKQLSKPNILFYALAGIDAEFRISKIEFEKWLSKKKSERDFKLLYFYDVRTLIGSLQNLIQESRLLLSMFYKALNKDQFMISEEYAKNHSLINASGLIVTNVFSKVNHLFINLASQLDFITKIAFECENLPTSFSKPVKLRSSSILYGQSKRLSLDSIEDTVLEKTAELKLIIALRNEIIHNSSFEGVSKVYLRLDEKKLVEKYILIPDHFNGTLESFNNRNRFFDKDIKLNVILPSLMIDFWKRMLNAIQIIGKSSF